MSNPAYSLGIPSSFDPALLLSDSCALEDVLPYSSHSDELDAIAQTVAEEKADKTRRKIVIQHRAWDTLDAFRSEEDYPIGIAASFERCSRTSSDFSRHAAQTSDSFVTEGASPVVTAPHAARLLAHRISCQLRSEARVAEEEKEIGCRP